MVAWALTSFHSRSSSEPGLRSTLWGTPIVPMSWNRAPSLIAASSSSERPRRSPTATAWVMVCAACCARAFSFASSAPMSAPITERCDSSRRSLVRFSMSLTLCSSALRSRTSLDLLMYRRKPYPATSTRRLDERARERLAGAVHPVAGDDAREGARDRRCAEQEDRHALRDRGEAEEDGQYQRTPTVDADPSGRSQ